MLIAKGGREEGHLSALSVGDHRHVTVCCYWSSVGAHDASIHEGVKCACGEQNLKAQLGDLPIIQEMPT